MEAEDLGPDGEFVGELGDLEPDLVLVEGVQRQIGQAGVLLAADPVLGVRAEPVPDF